jgi:hypothetical protein
MLDSIVISASCADLPPPVFLPTGGQGLTVHAAQTDVGVPAATPPVPDSGGSGEHEVLLLLDHQQFEADIAASKARMTRPSHRLTALIRRLCTEARLPLAELRGPGTGLVSGSQFGCAQVYEMHSRLLRHGARGVDAVRFAQATHSYPVSAAAIEFGLQGPCLAVVSGGQAGADAMTCASDWLREARCDRVLVAAYEDFSPPLTTYLQQQVTPDVLFGEAMVLLLLERQKDAQSRGLKPVQLPLEPEVACPVPEDVDYLGANALVALHRKMSTRPTPLAKVPSPRTELELG